MLTGGGSIDNKGVDQEIFTYYVKSYEIYLVDISKGIREIHHDYEKSKTIYCEKQARKRFPNKIAQQSSKKLILNISHKEFHRKRQF